MKKDKRPTMDDVARLAEVSRQTVSRVLNNDRHVSDPTRSRVLDAMFKLEYRRDPSARSLAMRRTFLLGVLTSSFSRYVHSRTLEGAECYARSRGYSVIVSGCESTETGEPLGSMLIRDQPLEGLLILYHGSTVDRFHLLDEIPRDLPIVTTGYAKGSPSVTAINIANEEGAEIAAKRLLDDGRRNIAVITGPQWDFDAVERSRGFRRAMANESVPVDDRYVRSGDWTLESGYAAMVDLMRSGVAIDGVFSHNDQQAVGAIRAIHEAGLTVPGDIAVVGFDDLPLARYVEPSLTTMRHPSYELGETCVRELIARLEDAEENQEKEREESIRLVPELIVRESCP